MWAFVPSSFYAGVVRLIICHILDIMSESATSKEKKSKAEIELLVKLYGGKIFQTENAAENTWVIGDRSENSYLHVSNLRSLFLMQRM